MTEPLSPAAQAIADAFEKAWLLSDADPFECYIQPVGAALRAAADKLSQEVDAPKVDGSKYAGIWHAFDYLQAIAAELENYD